MKLISVVIPVLNRADLIIRTLDSIAAQDLSSCSIIVVDNGSTDGTREAVLRWAEAHRNDALDLILLHEERKGAAVARNTGLRAVRTPWVMFFDSDDVMLQGHLAAISSTIEANPGTDIIGFDTRNSSGKRLIFATDPWDILFRGGMATQRLAARTSLVRRAGGWNEDLSVWDDIELGARMLALNPKVVKISSGPSVVVYKSPDSITAREERLDAEAILGALDRLRDSLPVLTPAIPFKIAIVAGLNKRNNPETSRFLLGRATEMLPDSRHKIRLVWRLAQLNPPGITHITKKFINFR